MSDNSAGEDLGADNLSKLDEMLALPSLETEHLHYTIHEILPKLQANGANIDKVIALAGKCINHSRWLAAKVVKDVIPSFISMGVDMQKVLPLIKQSIENHNAPNVVIHIFPKLIGTSLDEIIQMTDRCIVRGASTQVAEYILPKLINTYIDMDTSIKMTEMCVLFGGGSKIVECVLPVLIDKGANLDKVITLARECRAIQSVIEHFIPVLIEKVEDIQTVLPFILEYQESKEEYGRIADRLPEIIEKLTDIQVALPLVKSCIRKNSSFIVAQYTLPILIGRGADLSTVSELAQLCIQSKGGGGIAVARYVLPEMVRKGSDLKTVIELANICVEKERASEVAQYCIPEMILRGIDPLIVIELTQLCIKEGASEVAAWVMPLLFKKEHKIEQMMQLIAQLNKESKFVAMYNLDPNIMGEIWDYYIKEINRYSQDYLTSKLPDNERIVKSIQSTFGLDNIESFEHVLLKVVANSSNDLRAIKGNNKIITPKVLKTIITRFVDRIALSTDKTIIDQINQNPTILQMFELAGIDLGVSSTYGINSLSELPFGWGPEGESLKQTFGAPFSVNSVKTTFTLNPEYITQANQLMHKVTGQIEELNKQLSEYIESPAMDHRSLIKFLHDQVQEQLPKKPIDQSKVNLLKEDLEELTNLFVETSHIQKDKRGNIKVVPVTLSRVPKGSLMEAISGAIADACYLEETIPENIEVINIQQNAKIKGNFLLIHAKQTDEEEVVIIRAVNPRETFSRATDQSQLVAQIAQQVKTEYPGKTVLMVCDDVGGASTNRALTHRAIEQIVGNAPIYSIDDLADPSLINFNDNPLRDALRICVHEQ